MSKFLNGLFVGIGIGLFIAPQTGEETRRLIMQRIAALRKSMPTEDDQHISIDTRPSQITSFPVRPSQPLAAVSIEPQGPKTTSTNPADTSTTTSTQSTNPADTSTTTSAQSTNPADINTTTSTNPADTSTTTSAQSTNNGASNRNATNSVQTSGLTTSYPTPITDFNLETSTEESENTAKLPKLSNPAKQTSSSTSGQSANRKASNTNKPRNNKS